MRVDRAGGTIDRNLPHNLPEPIILLTHFALTGVLRSTASTIVSEEAALKVLYYTDDGKTNFGDDLNRWLWGRLLDLSREDEDRIYLLGIGTVISKGLMLPNREHVIIGSGVGYDVLPEGMNGPSTRILAVRGPLTARILGLPENMAITDAAALLRLLPECTPLPESEREGIAFMPHYSTLDDGNWEQICGLAGLTFLSPFDNSENTVQRIRGARLIIADAMHAAIVADALRVPWIPVALSPESNTFKWLDWTQSLGLPYKPVYLGASTVFEAIGNFSYWFRGIRHYSANRDIAHAIRKFRRDQHRRSRNSWRRWSHAMFLLTYRLPKRVLALKPLQAIRVQWDRLLTRHAVRALEEAAKLPANLSDDSVFDAKLRRFEKLIEEVRERGLRTTV